jgi:broad-specificity NMP kinase
VPIIFITGVSGAGKTTLYGALRKDPDLAHVEFHDIDEDGIPPAGTGAWRQFRVELLLHEAATRSRTEDRSTVICGVSKPHEVIESGAFPDDLDVHFVLVDVSTPVLRKRLEARLAGQPTDDIEFSVQWNRLLSPALRRSVQQQRNGTIIEASRLSRVKVREQVKQLIQNFCA